LVDEAELCIIVSTDEGTASHLKFKVAVTADIKRISDGERSVWLCGHPVRCTGTPE
jgi:hypothetical protein